MTEDTDKCYTTEIDEGGEPLRQNLDAAKPSDFEEAKRKYKALCYEDICLWIVQNPKRGERDLLAMEVHLRNHKGVDNKPKPTTFLSRENPLAILCPISHILTRAIRDNAILVDGYTSAEPHVFVGGSVIASIILRVEYHIVVGSRAIVSVTRRNADSHRNKKFEILQHCHLSSAVNL